MHTDYAYMYTVTDRRIEKEYPVPPINDKNGEVTIIDAQEVSYYRLYTSVADWKTGKAGGKWWIKGWWNHHEAAIKIFESPDRGFPPQKGRNGEQ